MADGEDLDPAVQAILAEEGLLDGEKEEPSSVAEPPVPSSKPTDPWMFRLLQKVAEYDLLLWWGDTRAGKTKCVSQIAMETAGAGYKVLYFDTERNLQSETIAKMKDLGVEYRNIPEVSKVRDLFERRQLKTRYDLIVIDSATLEITGKWGPSSQRQKGDILLDLENLYYRLKHYCQKNRTVALIVGQPVSEFGEKGLKPMGDKANFFIKESWYVVRERDKEPPYRTLNRRIIVFDSRVLPDGMTVTDFTTQKIGVTWGRLHPDLEDELEV